MAHVANTTTFAALEGGVAWAMQTLTDPARGKLYFIERNITDVGGKLSAIERNTRGGFNASEGSNTRDVFWWTTWAIVVMLGLFILNLLVRVLAQLVTLNGYQSTFQKMWAEDRANDDRIRREEKRERHIWQMRGLSPQQAAQAEAYLNGLVDSVGEVPDSESEEYEEWVADMRDAVGVGFDD